MLKLIVKSTEPPKPPEPELHLVLEGSVFGSVAVVGYDAKGTRLGTLGTFRVAPTSGTLPLGVPEAARGKVYFERSDALGHALPNIIGRGRFSYTNDTDSFFLVI